MDDLHAFAAAKLRGVLGASRGDALLREVLEALGIERITTPEELERFGLALRGRGVLEESLGALLSSRATMIRVKGR